MAIARFPGLVIDCPDSRTLAAFYAAMLGWEVAVKEEDDWVDIRPAGGSDCISFQQVDDYRPPTWPGQDAPQQMHLDVIVDDLDEGEAAVLHLGATKHDTQPGEKFRVFLDPAGHPFCLCVH
jgi:catechol 2,3-dioxygenase-like lactoylglutathione lyase family enzyme